MTTRIFTPIFVACVMVLASTAIAQPASDLLEKAIYTEETVGDLDAAIGIYQQILNDAEANRKLAASAQYRLAMCYQKKGLDTESAEAFEKLIENYPDQTELIAEARKHMPGRPELGPVPWRDGEIMRMSMKLPAGLVIGTWAWTADKVKTDDGKEAWCVKTRRYVAINGTQGVSGVIAEADTFRPVSSWFKHTLLGEINAVYTPTEVQIEGEGRGEDGAKTVTLHEMRYDNEQAVQLIRRLPLEVGYKTELPLIVTFTGKRLDVPLEVLEKQTVTVAAGEFECYKVDLVIEKILHQTMWFSADANRYMVKLNAEGIVGELVSVTHRETDKPNAFHDQKLGFSLSAPADWYIYEFGDDEPDATKLHLIDAEASAFYVLNVQSLETAEIDPDQSLREFAEGKVADIKKRAMGYTIRPDSWDERSINGQTTLSLTADYEERDDALVDYRTYILGEETVGRFKVVCEADNFEIIKPKIDQIIATYKAK